MALFGNKKHDNGKSIIAKTMDNFQLVDDIEDSNNSDKVLKADAIESDDIQDTNANNDTYSDDSIPLDKQDETSEFDKRVGKFVDELIEFYTVIDPMQLNLLERGKVKQDTFIADVKHFIKTKQDATKEEQVEILRRFTSFLWSYDIIDELLDDDEISDIKIYRWDHIRVKRLRDRETSSVKFRDELHFKRFVEHTAIKNKIGISQQEALQNFTDKETNAKAILRFNISNGLINSNDDYLLSIRKIPKVKYTREQFINFGFFTAEQADYLEKRAADGGGILVVGQGGSGKTHLLNYLLEHIPYNKSGLVVQENEELFSNLHPDLAFQHTVINKGEGKITYTLKDICRNGLLMDIDYFIIGEIKGDEALYLLNAVYTGAKGWASVHGASATEAMKKLVDYIKYNSTYSQEEALQMLVHLDTVVFMKEFSVHEIQQIVGYDADKKDLIYKEIKWET